MFSFWSRFTALHWHEQVAASLVAIILVLGVPIVAVQVISEGLLAVLATLALLVAGPYGVLILVELFQD